MVAWLMSHQAQVLMALLTLSELLGALGAKGIVPGAISLLKSIGAKDVDGQ